MSQTSFSADEHAWLLQLLSNVTLPVIILISLAALRRHFGGGSWKSYNEGSPTAGNNGKDSFSGNEAELRWAAGHGRWKHRGLRPDPFDENEGPPEYSLEPLDLPLPEMTREQASKLKALQQRVRDLSGSFRTDLGTLIRFLRARQFDLDAAEAYVRKAAKWWDANGVRQALTTWNLEAYEQCLAPWYLSGGFLGHRKAGGPVAYERLSRCQWPKLCTSVPFEELAKLDIIHVLRSLGAIEEDSLRRGAPIGNGLLIEDCEGFTWDCCRFHPARMLSKLVDNRNLMMPECISQILVIRAPAAWVQAWSLFSYLLDPGIRRKVRVAGAGRATQDLLKEFLDDDEIPAYLGGRKCIEGDPECSKVIAPGGLPPPEALQRFFSLIAEQKAVKRNDQMDPKPGQLSDSWWSCCTARPQKRQ